MTQELVTSILIPFFTALIAWFFARKKNKAALMSMQTENEIKASKYYQDLLDDMSERLDKAIKELMALEARHSKLMEVNRQLVAELQKFKQLNGKQGK